MIKRFLVIGIILLFVFMSINPSFAVDNVKKTSMPVSDGNFLYVGGSGLNNYTRIQDAIDNTSNGDTVFVYDDSSPYYENVVVDKSINLIGENRNTTIIDGGDIDTVIEVFAGYIYIEGFTIANSKLNSCGGINIYSDWNVIRNNNIIENGGYGIKLTNSSNNTIKNNYLKDNVFAHIDLSDNSNYNNISNNYLTKSVNWPLILNGIKLEKSIKNNIEGNIITDYRFDDGISLDFDANYNIVTKNIIQNNQNEESICISIWGGYYNKVIDNEIKNIAGDGIMCPPQTVGNEISKNTLQSIGRSAIAIGHGIKIIIKENEISYAKRGILICIYSHDNEITSNNISNCIDGIILYGTKNNNSNNTVTNNNLIENEYGVHILLHETGPSSGNLIYHNNFIKNEQNANDECNNTWDNGYPWGGNYWDDYNGTDADGDGIGDTPYNLTGGDNQDRYPLMLPYINQGPPGRPRIGGETNGKIGEEYNYTFVTIDPDGDKVYYYIDWGDNTSCGWIGPFDSGVEINESHTWSEKGKYIIQAKAKDVNDKESGWGTFEVKIPRNKIVTNTLFLRFLERFPILKYVFRGRLA